MVHPDRPIPHDSGAEYRERFPGPAWWPHPANAKYVHRLLDLAASRGIRVYWLLPPVEPPLRRLCEAGGQESAHLEFVRRATAGRSNVVVIDARSSADALPVFRDGVHLVRRGAAALSEALAGPLGDRGAAGWVRLPALRDAEGAGAVEDLDGSRLAVSGEAVRQ